MSGELSPAEQLAREFAALNKATQRAHTAIAEMRQCRAELRETIAEGRALHKDLATATAERADVIVTAAITPMIGAVLPDLQSALDEASGRIMAEFNRLANLMMDGNADSDDLETSVQKAMIIKNRRML